ncbi:MAG: hypothetical protein ACLQDM_28390 [Bradyrhizobium sp.]
MISRFGYGWAGLLLLAAGLGLTPLPAHAQAVPPNEEANAPAMETEAADPDETALKDDAALSDADIRDLDWSQLNVDASTLMTSLASKAPGAPRAGTASDLTWSSKDNANGSAVSVKQPISPFWDTRVGADMTVTRQPATMSELLAEKVANGGSEPQSSGTAWAAITAPGVATIWDKTAVEARVDPLQDQSKLGTSLSKSLSLSEQYSLTLQNGYDVIQQGAVPAHSSLPCADCVNLSATPGRATRNYETEQTAKLSIADTGTSFSAGQTLSSYDDKWLRKIGAEQKLFGGVSVSGSISETPLGTSSKSISAGFKQSW